MVVLWALLIQIPFGLFLALYLWTRAVERDVDFEAEAALRSPKQPRQDRRLAQLVIGLSLFGAAQR